MELEKLRKAINYMPCPGGIQKKKWNFMKFKMLKAWECYLNGEHWDEMMPMMSSEQLRLLIDQNGKLIVRTKLIRCEGEFTRKNLYWFLLDLGEKRALFGDYVSAEKIFSSAVHTYHGNSLALFNRGVVRIEMNKFKPALDDFNLVLSRKHFLANTCVNISRIFSEMDMDNKAMHHLNEAISHDKTFVEAYQFRAQLHFINGDTKDAERDLLKVLEFNPDNTYAQSNLQYILSN